MAKEITFLKGNLCIFKCFIDVLYIFLFGAKEKLQNVPRFEMDFELNFDFKKSRGRQWVSSCYVWPRW